MLGHLLTSAKKRGTEPARTTPAIALDNDVSFPCLVDKRHDLLQLPSTTDGILKTCQGRLAIFQFLLQHLLHVFTTMSPLALINVDLKFERFDTVLHLVTCAVVPLIEDRRRSFHDSFACERMRRKARLAYQPVDLRLD